MPALPRRDFLRLAGLAGLGLAGLPGLAGAPLAADEPAAAPAAGDGYKAVVCLFLDGGMDHHHVVSPHDPDSYAALAALRPEVGLRPRDAFLALAGADQEGRRLAFHPAMAKMHRMYGEGRIAYISSVGELSRPTTRAEVMDGRYRPGRAAGSHNDGAAYANALGYEGTQYGWGGLMLDAVMGMNTRQGLARINLYDTAFAAGRLGQRTQVNSGADADNLLGLGRLPVFADEGLSDAMHEQLVRSTRRNLIEDACRSLARHVDGSALEAREAFAASEAAVPAFTWAPGTPFYAGRDNDLARQFRSVARLMHQRSAIGVRRQVFNLGLRGFDTHGGGEDALTKLMGTIDHALEYFFARLTDLGLLDAVTVVVNTEFGRSLNGNRSGTDHGWAGGWFVAGGAVRGGRVYGRIPVIDPLGPDFQSRYNPTQIPAVAPEQIGATVARWFGVPEADVAQIFPRLAEFPQRDLGFLGGTGLTAVAASRSAAAPADAGRAEAAGDGGGSCGAGGGLAAAAIAGLLALRGGGRS